MKPLAILVVDDQPIMREVLAQILEDAGHEVRVSAGGIEALREMAETAFDVLVTDLVMPGMDGLELIGEVRRRHPDVRIVAMSAGSERYSDRAALSIAERLGAGVLLAKPFPRDHLVLAIDALCPLPALA